MLGWIAQGLGVLLLVVVVLVAGIFTYLRTDAGLAHLARLIEGLASSEEHINHRKSRGAFPEHLRLENISLTDDQGTLITTDFVELRWRPWKLLSRHLNVTAFEAGTVDVNRLPAAQGERRQNKRRGRWGCRACGGRRPRCFGEPLR